VGQVWRQVSGPADGLACFFFSIFSSYLYSFLLYTVSSFTDFDLELQTESNELRRIWSSKSKSVKETVKQKKIKIGRKKREE
jgi:hypothetical protein